DYGGTLLFVSHDRLFIEALATRVVEITPGVAEARVRNFVGGYPQDAETVAREAEPRSAPKPKAARPQPAPRRTKPKDNAQRKLKERSTQLEREIESLEAAITRLDWLAADPEVAKDGERMREIAAERRAQKEKLDALYPEWERISADLE